MSRLIGTIVDFDPFDALGWIALDDGERVRFGGTSLRGFATPPGVGTRVEVNGTTPGFRGVTKAVAVVPLATPGAAPEPQSTATPWPAFVNAHPRWSDAADTCVPCRRRAPPPSLPTHPLFAPWHAEIAEAAPTVVELRLPGHARQAPFEPGAGDCFAHGRVAFLDTPRWPTCGICARPLEMCLQLSPEVLADFLPGDLGLSVLFCFHCGVRESHDQRVGHVRAVAPRHRVVGPEAWSSASSGWRAATQRVTPGPPTAVAPGVMWHRYRSVHVWGTAASALLGFGEPDLCGPFPAGVAPEDLDDVGEVYEAWLDGHFGADRWGGGRLGGVAGWDQADETPSCAHGEMLHLLDYNGGQFLDGALHVFACSARACALAFVAEF